MNRIASRQTILICIISLIFILRNSGGIAQTVQYNTEFQINTSTIYDQFDPDICGLSDGGFVICWNHGSHGGKMNDIYAQVFNSDWTKNGSEILVNTTRDMWHNSPQICGLIGGGYVICWRSWISVEVGYRIFAQIYKNNNEKYGEEFQIDTETDNYQADPAICSLSDGGFIVSWTEDDGNQGGIFAQFFNEIGIQRGGRIQVNTHTTERQMNPSICELSDGGIVICWHSWDQDGDGYGIFGQIYNQDGTKRGKEFQVNSQTQGFQMNPQVAGLESGEFIICWSSGHHIRGQLYHNNGSKKGEEFKVNTYEKYNYLPPVCQLNNNKYVISWTSSDSDQAGVGAQICDNTGSKIGKEFLVNTYTKDSQKKPKICHLFDDYFVVCWQSNEQDGDGEGLYGKYYQGTPILHLLHPFSLISPEFDSISNLTTVTFKWRKASPLQVNLPWELEYKLYLDISEDFNNTQIFSDIYDTTFTVKQLTPGQTYFWKVLVKNIEGDSLWSSETFGFFVSPDATQIIHDRVINAQDFKLFSNYPNPFNPETTIRYSLPVDQSSYRVIIKIYDVLGQLVVSLRDEQQRPGLYQLNWDGRNTAGQAVPSGVYFCVLDAGSFKATQKMLLVK